MSNPIKATIIMVSLSSVVILFQGILQPRLPVTTPLIILIDTFFFYFTLQTMFLLNGRKHPRRPDLHFPVIILQKKEPGGF